jgi:hypothetical protein
MFRAMILWDDDTVLMDAAEVQVQNSKRGDSLVWRGVVSIPPMKPRPAIGEMIYLQLDDRSEIAAVVTGVEGTGVHCRAHSLSWSNARDGRFATR